jgi:signal transduction histidine kinase
MNKRNLILIIDDIPENLRVLGDMLEMAGYEVLVATNGPDALRKVQTLPTPDLILLDVLMPGMDGFEVCRQLKSNLVSKTIPVIFISAVGETEQKVQAFQAGAVDYITKPFQSEEVVVRVHTHLQLATLDELKREITERKLAEESLKDSQEKLAALTAELGLTEERERRRIALALHDQVVQDLALGKLKLDQALKKGLIPEHTVVADLQEILNHSMRDLRTLCSDLSPYLLYELGLKEAIENLGERYSGDHGFRFTISGDESIEMREYLRITLFQMARELLINVIKHANASSVTVLIAQSNGTITLEIVDDGVGFDLATQKKGFGLAYIHQRVGFHGGTLKIVTGAGVGTRVVIVIPANVPNKGAVDESQNSAGR